MNEDDKKRFARYRKDYVPSPDDEFIINKSKLGEIEEVNIKKCDLVKNILNNITNNNTNNNINNNTSK
jgi:hypothetical protein